MKILNICNPQNRRAQFFREACERLGLPSPKELAWIDFISNQEAQPAFAGIDLIRIESPGEDFEVEKKLIELGGGPTDLEYDLGRVRYQPEWYRGWCQQLRRLQTLVGDRIPFINHPADIETLFDKWASQRSLFNAGISVPRLLNMVEDYDQFHRLLEEARIKRCFLKPIHSSSASGVVAFQMASREKMLATTSAELIPTTSAIYNSLKLRYYRNEQLLRQLIDTLATQNLMAEAWFPKANFEGMAYDLRVLVIAGNARHVVVRTSRSPITNLHLGNARGDVDQIRADLSEPTWQEGMTICEQAAATCPNCHYVAVDLMVSASKKQFAVAEMNAFGDLIPNILSHGDDTYTAELKSLLL